MISGFIGKKIGMTRIFREGRDIPVTVIQAGACYVAQKKTVENEGYNAVQLGFLEKKEKGTTKSMQGHFKKAGTKCFYHLREFGCDAVDSYKQGQRIAVSEIFKVGDILDVSGTSKGKGFMGVMRRHHFSGGAESHGSMFNRAPGSIGSSSYPSRVFKGMRMGGHMGACKKTVQNIEVVDIREKDDIIMLKGNVPGHRNGIVIMKKAVKRG